MSIITSIVIIVLSLLIIASLQLVPGTFSIFYHYALGKHGTKQADNLSLNYILGVELFICFIWFITYLLIFITCYNLTDFCQPIVFWTLSGICLAEAIAILCFYFRRESKATTALFLPRHIANTISARAHNIKTRSDAITLGFFSGLPELIFTLPLYIISSILLLSSTTLPRAIIIILFVVAATSPLFVIHIFYRTGHNLADITRFRSRIKPFLRIGLSIVYFFLALVILSLGTINHG